MPDTLPQRWMYALKPASWPKLLVPMLLGQGLGIAASDRRVALSGFVFGLLFTLLDLIFIVLLNDWFDRDVDALKRRMFPQSGSPKTIPDGILPPWHLLCAGLLAAALAGLISLGAGLALHPGLFPAGISCLVIFAAYSAPPLHLNYRGGGELLEMLGVGVALPWLNAYALSRQVWFAELAALGGFALLSLASAVASGLSDEESDRRGGKRTIVTQFGNARARALVEVLVPAGAIVWLLTALLFPHALPLWAAAPAAAVALWGWRRLRRCSNAAVTNSFAAQGAYKQELHRAIWGGGLALAAAISLRAAS
jgi:1,4-dihydroxy-2-naphthoate octaprenyltransferase/chlorophyll synthase